MDAQMLHSVIMRATSGAESATAEDGNGLGSRAPNWREPSLSTSATAVLRMPVVLADVVPGARTRDAVLVLAGALLTVLGAQVAIQVPPSPVPITGQTLAVVAAGAALGWRPPPPTSDR